MNESGMTSPRSGLRQRSSASTVDAAGPQIDQRLIEQRELLRFAYLLTPELDGK